MDLGTFIRIVLRGWWLILLATLATVASASYTVSRKPLLYRATARVVLQPSLLLPEARQVLDAMNALDKRTTINTLARNATGNSMQNKVATVLKVPPEVIDEADITAVVVPETNLIEIRAQSNSPEAAAAIANTVADQLRTQVPQRVIELEITDRAEPPTFAIEPQPVRILTLAMVFGVVVGIGFALLGHFVQQYGGSLGKSPQPVLDAEAANAKTQQFYVQ